MSQKPAKSRDNGADGTSSRDNVAADASSESPESADAAEASADKRMQAPPGRTPVSQTSLQRSSAVPQASHGRAASVTRAATWTGSRNRGNDDSPQSAGSFYALQQRPSKSPFYIALATSAIWFVLGCLIAGR